MNETIMELRAALKAGRTTSVALVRAYRERIARLDAKGPKLNAVRHLNPDAEEAARASDARSGAARPLEGIPILLKDNIATGDGQPTTAGSAAMEGARAKRDAMVAARLRRAGAVILGKTNLTEWANMMAVGMPAGWSSLGGQCRNPWAPEVDANGIPVVPTGGSSAGSGVAVAAGYAAAAIGSETAGSLLSPASQNGLVTVKPTVGLLSQAGIIPISHNQDVAGPMTRTVADAALLLDVLAGPDERDAKTLKQKRPESFLAGLDPDALKGARIGVPSDPAHNNDPWYGPLSPSAKLVMERAIAILADAGAVIVRAGIEPRAWVGGPGTEMAVLNNNPLSPGRGRVERVSSVFLYELKAGVDAYLRDWAVWEKGARRMRALGDVVSFNDEHAARCLRFGQDFLREASLSRGDLTEPAYRNARKMDVWASRTIGIDPYLRQHRLDAILFPSRTGAGLAAKAGYPSVMVPAGMVTHWEGIETKPYPYGITFTGPAWSEARLLALAYAFEAARGPFPMPRL
jgi:amidase